MSDAALAEEEHIKRLCPACGLCCNGVLFADVRLQSSDNAKRLADLGVVLSKRGRKIALAQPCACYDGKWCRVYAERPARCRNFECGLLTRVSAGGLTADAALQTIAEVQQQAQAIRDLLRRLGNTEENISLSRRYAKLMAEPIDLAAGEEAADLRGELMVKVARLMNRLHRDFLA